MSQDYLVKIKQATGLNAVTLAFALGGSGGCAPMWGGQEAIDAASVLNPIKNFQKAGGTVIVSTGGAMGNVCHLLSNSLPFYLCLSQFHISGPYLETSCSSPSALAAAYKKALQTVGTNHLDIDIGTASSKIIHKHFYI